MGSMNLLQVSPTADRKALNAGMYGFAEHGMLTPHSALKQSWWTDERIHNRVNRKFVVRTIKGTEREFLDKSIGFGEDLTDDTYLDWILYRAQRLFLILAHINCADRIFGLADDSWTDEDLPVPRSDVKRLELADDNDEKLNRRFYEAQFFYLLRRPNKGEHVSYDPSELIPMDYMHSMSPAVSLSRWHRVHFPENPEMAFVRRKFDLSQDVDSASHKLKFLEDVTKSQSLRHEHIAPIWASYTTEYSGFTLTDFIAEHTLSTFMSHRCPPQYSRLSEAQRPCLVLEWMHCLADAVSFLHSRGESHGSIRPSNIVIDPDNCIAFSDVGSLKTFSRDRSPDRTEVRDYTPPDHCRGATLVSRRVSPASSEHQLSSTNLARLPKTPCVSHVPGLSLSSTITSTTVSTSRSLSPPSPRTINRKPVPPARKDSAQETDEYILATMPPLSAFPTPPISPKTPRSPASEYGVLSPYDGPSTDFDTLLGRVNSPHSVCEASIPRIMPAPPPTKRLPTLPSRSNEVKQRRLPLSSSQSTIKTTILVQDSPEETQDSRAGDVFSLGCVYLEMLTFLCQGKLNDFNKYRRKTGTSPHASTKRLFLPDSPTLSFNESRSSAPSISSKKTGLSISTFATYNPHGNAAPRQESFFASPQRVDPWMERLRFSAMQQPSADLYLAVAELITLIKRMLERDPEVRPSALEVRDALENTLTNTCGIGGLCCAGRSWDVTDAEGHAGGIQRGPSRSLSDEIDKVRKEVKVRREEMEAEAEKAKNGAITPESGPSASSSNLAATERSSHPRSGFSDDSDDEEEQRPRTPRSAGWKMPPMFKRRQGPVFKMP